MMFMVSYIIMRHSSSTRIIEMYIVGLHVVVAFLYGLRYYGSLIDVIPAY